MQKYLIKTKHLGLRLLETEDIHFLDKLESDPEVKQFFPNGTRNRHQTKMMIKKFISYYEGKGLPCMMVFELQSGEFAGRSGFGITKDGDIEVGYVFHKKFWGKGYASEAVTALLQYAKKHISAEYIIAYADSNNIGSIRVMKKCGMEYYKTDNDQGVECQFYRIRNR